MARVNSASGAEGQGASRTDKMVALLGHVLGLLQPESDAVGRLGEEGTAVSRECREMLVDLLPYPLIIVLERQGPCALARTLAADTILPTVVWTKGMREVLWKHLHSHLDGFEMELAVSPDAIWQFARAEPVKYHQHEDGDWLGGQQFGYYLTLLALQLREDATENVGNTVGAVAPADVTKFQSLLLARLDTEKIVKKQAVLLSILAGLLHQAPAPPVPKPAPVPIPATAQTPNVAVFDASKNVAHPKPPAHPHHAQGTTHGVAHTSVHSPVPPLVPPPHDAANVPEGPSQEHTGAGGPDLKVLAALLEQHAPAATIDGSNAGIALQCTTIPVLETVELSSQWQKWEEITRDQDRLEVLLHSICVCQWIITPRSVAGRILAADAACAAAAIGTAIRLRVPDIVEGILRWSIEGIFYLPEAAAKDVVQHPLRPLLPLALACVRFCEEVARSTQGLHRLEKERSLIEILVVCLQCDDASIIEAATSCVGRLCASARLHAALVEGHLHLLLLRQLLRDVHW